MARLVTIYGGSGFVGRQIARVMAAEGWRVRVAVRRPHLAGVVRMYGHVGQVQPVFCNVRDDLSVQAAMTDADAVINCVGILVGQRRNTFEAIHHEAAGRIARISAELGVERLVHLSAIGADPDSDSRYAATKGKGEQAILQHRPDAVILRPSVIFGPDDKFFNKLGGMMRLGPVVPLPGANAELQPVFVDDVAHAAMMGATGEAEPGIYELGGPDVMTMREIARLVALVTSRRRWIMGLPGWMAGLIGVSFDALQTVSGGLVMNRVITRDQARQLRRPNRVGQGVRTFADLGIQPAAAAAVVPEYLWRFRPSGQYTAIKDSAKNLRPD
ncbi:MULTISPECIES: complex I NDUFA9 subunit family protein [unclassified Paracoccus (in: a-proteobacteria)]|uniref:complex I NDUFA9 subunit family protein n=1 Tax=unclassified Paracoccus (in: a-proteobacteria) TaxID=2688777 RepID=UPI0016012CAD|nr:MULTISPECIES: complex I NDUFA9 subunit family protein [unclassified Paracoccus (in: a-proteobacteria)]MBB1490197.1 complex I NDUFA9 subunit family protein [Paracoccus sp. MC1854]MBB1498815.1 complex I NDUFA9 subunit family protein [Paracoccus sp. MC1862]QQO43782.1 complex I NDUFA9 subunit family protein [Paracoccus sp. MC1862]